MKKLLSGLLVIILCFGNVSFARAEDEPTDNEKAIAIIDGFIQEMEELGDESFNDEVIGKELSDSYLWAKRLENAKKNIFINSKSMYEFCNDLGEFIGGQSILNYYDKIDDYEERYYSNNSYNRLYSQLMFLEEYIQGKTNYSLNDIIQRGKTLSDNYNTLDNYMWLWEVNFLLNRRFQNTNLYKQASATYIWSTLYNNTGECINQYTINENVYRYTTKSERLDDFIKCLELLNDELENPFMQAMTVNVKVDKTAYDKYTEQKLNVTPAKSSNNSTTTSKTNTTTNTDNKDVVNVSVAGKKVSNMKLVAKKVKIKVVFAAMPNATKYQIQVATNKKFKKALKYTVMKPTKTIKKLKRNKVYYVRVRAISGKTKSKWVKKKIRMK
ncbi:hypothetical protein SAMN02745111_01837 [Eubacterium uniforme]|uniref:Fibronectin type-III domain-containing protein n=1 Tax=Eubacterium uniforme TaxID=39495 RepID=A0A1T4VX64_9FIRM|nr:hypothetical protein [Eubacterium uniforme]SKA69398.1 hypothetical protein SAMN02745111_01837 [Eubacterium uniforme]